MNGADRIALVERVARARSWTSLAEADRAGFRRAAEAIISELEIEREQTNRIGWIFVEVDEESETEGSNA